MIVDDEGTSTAPSATESVATAEFVAEAINKAVTFELPKVVSPFTPRRRNSASAVVRLLLLGS